MSGSGGSNLDPGVVFPVVGILYGLGATVVAVSLWLARTQKYLIPVLFAVAFTLAAGDGLRKGLADLETRDPRQIVRNDLNEPRRILLWILLLVVVWAGIFLTYTPEPSWAGWARDNPTFVAGVVLLNVFLILMIMFGARGELFGPKGPYAGE